MTGANILNKVPEKTSINKAGFDGTILIMGECRQTHRKEILVMPKAAPEDDGSALE